LILKSSSGFFKDKAVEEDLMIGEASMNFGYSFLDFLEENKKQALGHNL